MILNKTLSFWLIHKFDHYKGLLFFLLSRDFCCSGFICSTRLFFSSHKKTREKEWMLKQCQKLKSKVKESFVKLVNLFVKVDIYILCTMSHLVILSRWQSYLVSIINLVSIKYYQISKYYWFAFVWRCFLCLIFTIQHILTMLFLSEFNFESAIILFVAVSIYPPTATFQS